MSNRKVLLMILDGWGIGDGQKGDVIAQVHPAYISEMTRKYPHAQLRTDGENVGLPDGQMGNSEVGHLNIGAGRVVYQDLVKINRACRDDSILKNPEIVKAFEYAKSNGVSVHLMGLVSDGGVHSSLDHLLKLTDIADKYGIERTYVHCFMDGRDTDPRSGKGFIEALEAKMAELGIGKIASISGRYYAMDRDNRWDRVQKAYNAIALGEGEHAATAHEAMEQSYANGVTDEFVVPVIVTEGATVKDDDAIIFANFRPDRAREITRAFVDPEFTGFERVQPKIHYVCMTQYDATIPGVEIAFKPQSLKNTFGEYISDLGMTQLRIAETEKYAHVTFFFNGGVEKEYPGEDRALIPSPKVATYDLQPEMSEPAVTEECVKRILSGKYDVVILNFANCDMVGHTGVFEAAVKAIEATDDGVGKVVDAILKMGGQCLITADHGNVDQMLDADGVTPFTAHSTNPVPLVMVGHEGKLADGGVLADLAPTMLDMMGIPQPAEMTGHSLLIK